MHPHPTEPIVPALPPAEQPAPLTYEQAVAYMSGLLTFGMKLDRERFAALLARLGNPHERLRCVHVAGTNGKGSTTTFIASILSAAGYRVGAYLSPYVFDLRERIVVNGEMIGKANFARHVSEIRPHIEAIAQTELGQTTEFELKTAVAFRHFAEIGVDFAVIEVGIGGRLDATNVIPPPLVAVITNIGLDHQKILGETLAEIAAEKAGILKPGTFCVTAVEDGPAWDTIRRIANEQGVPVLRVRHSDAAVKDHDVWYNGFERGVTVFSPKERGEDTSNILGIYQLGLGGRYQKANASTAVAAVSLLRTRHNIAISAEDIYKGLQEAKLPGRFQLLRPEGRAYLILDVAHNEDGARVLVDALRYRFTNKRWKFTFVVGMSRTHEPAPFLEILQPIASQLVVTAPTFRPKPAEETLAAARSLGFADVSVIEPARDAIARTFANALPREVVVVSGSFYTVGETPESLRRLGRYRES